MVKKTAPPELLAASVHTQFKPGNPGRQKGSRNKLGEHFLSAMCDDFKDHGKAAIEKVRAEDPSTYVRVIASILPKEVEIVRPMSDLTDDELVNAIQLIRASLGSNAPAPPVVRGRDQPAALGKPH